MMDIGPSLPPGFKLSTGRSADSGNSRKEIGPLMPPGFKQSVKTSDSESGSDGDECDGQMLTSSSFSHRHTERQESHSDSDIETDDDEIGNGPGTVGPILLPRIEERKCSKTNSASSQSSSLIGPALPPAINDRQVSGSRCDNSPDGLHGPALPPHMLKSHDTSQRHVIGPAHLPPAQNISHDSSDDNDDVIGPRLPPPSDQDGSHGSTAEDIERRAQAMRDRLTNKDRSTAVPQRESWMTELPTSMKQDLGLTARTFRSGPAAAAASRNDIDEDKSVWTDTPADRERKQKEGSSKSGHKRKHSKDKHTRDRDKRLAKEVEKYNKEKRKESLMEMHQSKMKKKKKKEKEKTKERREFDRDADLQVNRFDDAQRKALIKKSQELNTRFGHGASQFM